MQDAEKTKPDICALSSSVNSLMADVSLDVVAGAPGTDLCCRSVQLSGVLWPVLCSLVSTRPFLTNIHVSVVKVRGMC